MLIRALIADDDMDVHHLMFDILEINFRDVKVERALSLQSFWAKILSNGAPWHLVFLSLGYINEEPDGFLGRLMAANPGVLGKTVLTGNEEDFKACAEDIRRLPFLAKPFSLDRFVEVVKSVHSGSHNPE